MNDEQFLSILSLVMVNTKMNLQIMHCLLNSDNCKKWDDAFESIENKYDEIMKGFMNKQNV